MIKTGIYSWFGYEIETQEKFNLIKDTGFDNVLLWWGNEYAPNGEDKNQLPEMARKAGLEIENVHMPFEETNYIWTDSINAEAIVERNKNCILDCAKHNIPTAVMHLTNGDTPPPFWQIGLDRIKSIIDLAERKNVNIAIENLRNPQSLQLVFSNIKSNKLGFCYDSGHENCYTKGVDFLELYGDKLMALHLHDNDGSDDQHRIIGEGTINWNSVASKLKATNYKGAVTLEIVNDIANNNSTISAQEYLRAAYEKLMMLF
jgi:sugar phosphate isomerase/epimerase